jgi:phosphoglycerate dehydrogenase-like enzyme
MKVVLSNKRMVTEEFLKDLQASFPEVTIQNTDTEEEQKQHIKDADVFYGMPSREVFLAADRLRWIQCPGTGIDVLTSIPEIVNSDVVLTNARGPHAAPMADHVMGVVLDFAHRARDLWEDQRAHRWVSSADSEEMVGLGGRTMGILALGGIGTAVARRAHAFGMEVYGVDVNPMPAPPGVKEVWGPERLDDLLEISDWFVVTVPFTSKTEGLIDRRRLGLLKRGAYIIVISRGGIVDEAALLEGLRSGRIAGAGVDAFKEEPLPADSPFWDMDNVMISPHVSALTPEMWEGRRQVFKENLRRFLANEPFLYVCDKEAGF